jgi:hypothetical protein
MRIGAYGPGSQSYEDIAVSGDVAYVIAGVTTALSVEAVDISNPNAPVFLDIGGAGHVYRNIAVSGDYAYVTSNGWFEVLDISNPAMIDTHGEVLIPTFLYDLAVSGDYAYVAGRDTGLIVIDVSNPSAPTVLGATDSPAYARGVAVAGDHVYVGDYYDGLFTFEILQSDYNLVDNVGYSDYIHSGSTVDSVRVTTTQTASVYWEVSADSGSHWQEVEPGVGWTTLDYPGGGLLWRSQHVYTGNGVNPTCDNLQIDYLGETSGVVDIRKPSTFSLSQCAPNPFATNTTIRFAVPEARRVHLSVHDVLGRKVATLVDGELAPDWYTHRWDGTDDADVSLSPGIYFIRFDAGNFTAVQKTVLLR